MHKFICIFILVCFYHQIHGQVFLQLNRYANPESKRFYEGQKLSYKTSEFPNDWFTKKIERFIIKDSIVVFDEGSLFINEITDLRIHKPVAQSIGNKLIQFGVLWMAYGGIIHLYDGDRNPFGWREAGIGLGSMTTGWLIKKIFYTKNYKINQKNRLKIMDLNF